MKNGLSDFVLFILLETILVILFLVGVGSFLHGLYTMLF